MYPDTDVLNTKLSPLCPPQGVQIQADPGINSDGVIEIELEKIVSLVCQQDSMSETNQELVWLRDGAAVQLKDGNKQGKSSVCVKPIYVDNGATFTCHQKQNRSISSSVTLNVTCKSMNNMDLQYVHEKQFTKCSSVFPFNIKIWRLLPKVSSVLFPSSPPTAL